MKPIFSSGLILLSLLTVLIVNQPLPTSAGDYDEILSRVPSEYRADIGRILDLAAVEWNDGELITALEHYPMGSAKHRAICFLIANMDKHLYVDYVHTDDPLNPFSPEDGSGEWLREYIWDYSTMSSELLIENVEWGFQAREEFPWCRNLPESVFFEYVLPYRSTQEPLHSWRPMVYETYKPFVAGLTTALEVAEEINSKNTTIFGFDTLYYRHPEDRDIPTLLSCGEGRCEDMSNLSNYSLRALGVPTTSDFTPRWPKGDNNHAWNAVYFEGTWYTFMGCEARTNPVYDSIKNRTFAKVYRKSFAADPIMPVSPDGTEPPRLMRTAALDVTAEYTEVSDIEIPVWSPTPAIYLTVHNFASWQAVAGAWAEDDLVTFTDVGNDDILYCVTHYVEDEFGWGDHRPVAQPFILHGDGTIEYTNPCPFTEPEGDITLTGWVPNGTLADGIEVTLFRYTGIPEEDADPMIEWMAVETVTTISNNDIVSATFENSAIEGGLYVLSDNPDGLRDSSRPFVWRESGTSYH